MEKRNIVQTTYICQIAMVVRDIEKATRRFAGMLGIDPPSIMTCNSDGSDAVTFRGEKTEGKAMLSFFKMENLDLEFIQPTADPSTWREFLDTHGPGVHHIAFKARNRMLETARELENYGYPLIQNGNKYAYNDSMSELGVILELLDID
jgi:methylmalonyl-CoA/ethylmalonyl-CoA epimerase